MVGSGTSARSASTVAFLKQFGYHALDDMTWLVRPNSQVPGASPNVFFKIKPQGDALLVVECSLVHQSLQLQWQTSRTAGMAFMAFLKANMRQDVLEQPLWMRGQFLGGAVSTMINRGLFKPELVATILRLVEAPQQFPSGAVYKESEAASSSRGSSCRPGAVRDSSAQTTADDGRAAAARREAARGPGPGGGCSQAAQRSDLDRAVKVAHRLLRGVPVGLPVPVELLDARFAAEVPELYVRIQEQFPTKPVLVDYLLDSDSVKRQIVHGMFCLSPGERQAGEELI